MNVNALFTHDGHHAVQGLGGSTALAHPALQSAATHHWCGMVYAPVGSSAVIHHKYGYVIGTEYPELEGIYIYIYTRTHTNQNWSLHYNLIHIPKGSNMTFLAVPAFGFLMAQ